MSQVNLDEDGYINTDWYITAAKDIIERGAEERGRDINKITANEMTPLFRQVYNALFRPDKRRLHGEKCNIEYNTENLTRLIEIYTALAGDYNILPSMEGLELLTGVNVNAFTEYVTNARGLISKTRRFWVQNALQGFPIGVVTLANHDIDTGLCYNRQDITDRATVSKALSFNDLVKIAEKSDDTQDIVVTDN